MQATLTYLLSERAQRGIIAATGTPTARRQTQTIEVTADDLPLLDISDDGSLSLDITGRYDKSLPAACRAIEAITGSNSAWTTAVLSEADMADVLAAIRRMSAERTAAALTAKALKRAGLERDRDAALVAVDAFMNDPALRLNDPGCGYVHVGGVRIDRDENEYHHLACPRWGELTAEDKRRKAVDAEAKLAVDAEAARVKAEKDAKDAAKEQAKTEFLGAWIDLHGSDSQRARNRDGLLCRDEAIRAMADATFGVAGAGVAVVYTADSRPLPDCRCDDCDRCEDCDIEYGVDEGAECLGEAQYDRLSAIKTALPGAQYNLRTRTAIHSCDHSPNCKYGSRPTVMVKIAVGPFTLQREYCL